MLRQLSDPPISYRRDNMTDPENSEHNKVGAARRAETFLASLRFATDGLVHVVTTQRNFRVHLVAAIAALSLGFTLGCSTIEFAVLVLTMGLVLVAEVANTVAETIVDLTSPEYHDLARIAKDAAAGGVLIAAITSVFVGCILFGPPLTKLLMKTVG